MRSAFAGVMAAIALVAAPPLAEAQQPAAKKEQKSIPPGSTFRCVAKDGRKYFGSAIPPECQGQAIDVISPTGVMVMRIDPAAEEKERQAKAAATAASAADAEAKKQRELANKDVERRHQA